MIKVDELVKEARAIATGAAKESDGNNQAMLVLCGLVAVQVLADAIVAAADAIGAVADEIGLLRSELVARFQVEESFEDDDGDDDDEE